MHEMAVDIDQAGAVRLLVDQMVVPDLVVEGARLGHAEVLLRHTRWRPDLVGAKEGKWRPASVLYRRARRRDRPAVAGSAPCASRLEPQREVLMAKARRKSKSNDEAKPRNRRARRPASRRPAEAAARRECESQAEGAAEADVRRSATHREEDFEAGLRRYAKYRDLGISKATNGMVQAHVIRFVPPCRPEEVSKRHYHDVDFQMVYVLKGWIKTRVRRPGRHVMRSGKLLDPAAAHRARGARLFGRLRSARNHPAGGLRDRGARVSRSTSESAFTARRFAGGGRGFRPAAP